MVRSEEVVRVDRLLQTAQARICLFAPEHPWIAPCIGEVHDHVPSGPRRQRLPHDADLRLRRPLELGSRSDARPRARSRPRPTPAQRAPAVVARARRRDGAPRRTGAGSGSSGPPTDELVDRLGRQRVEHQPVAHAGDRLVQGPCAIGRARASASASSCPSPARVHAGEQATRPPRLVRRNGSPRQSRTTFPQLLWDSGDGWKLKEAADRRQLVRQALAG